MNTKAKATTEKKLEKKPAPSREKSGKHCPVLRIIFCCCFLLSLIAIAYSAWTGWHNHHALEKFSQTLSQQTQLNLHAEQARYTTLKSQIEKLQQAWQQSQATDPKVIALHEANDLVRLANLNLTLAINDQAALKLLKVAEHKLQVLNDPSLNTLRGKLLGAIDQLENQKDHDATRLLLRLDQLTLKVNQLSFIPQHAPKATPSSSDTTPSSWKNKLKASLQSLKSLVVIHHQDAALHPILDAQQFSFLKEMVSLQLAKAQWAIMQQNTKIYQQALTLANHWLSQYNQHNTTAIQEITSTISQLKKQTVKPQYPDVLAALSDIKAALNDNPTKTLSKKATPRPANQTTPQKTQKNTAPHNLKQALPRTHQSVEI